MSDINAIIEELAEKRIKERIDAVIDEGKKYLHYHEKPVIDDIINKKILEIAKEEFEKVEGILRKRIIEQLKTADISTSFYINIHKR